MDDLEGHGRKQYYIPVSVRVARTAIFSDRCLLDSSSLTQRWDLRPEKQSSSLGRVPPLGEQTMIGKPLPLVLVSSSWQIKDMEYEI